MSSEKKEGGLTAGIVGVQKVTITLDEISLVSMPNVNT